MDPPKKLFLVTFGASLLFVWFGEWPPWTGGLPLARPRPAALLPRGSSVNCLFVLTYLLVLRWGLWLAELSSPTTGTRPALRGPPARHWLLLLWSPILWFVWCRLLKNLRSSFWLPIMPFWAPSIPGAAILRPGPACCGERVCSGITGIIPMGVVPVAFGSNV